MHTNMQVTYQFVGCPLPDTINMYVHVLTNTNTKHKVLICMHLMKMKHISKHLHGRGDGGGRYLEGGGRYLWRGTLRMEGQYHLWKQVPSVPHKCISRHLHWEGGGVSWGSGTIPWEILPDTLNMYLHVLTNTNTKHRY